MQTLTPEIKRELVSYANKCAPEEMCGLIVQDDKGISFLPVPNEHADPTRQFTIPARVIHDTLSRYSIHAIVHSHPTGSTLLSDLDTVAMNEQELPFVIVGMFGDIAVHYPKMVKLLGRPYVHGKMDCYTIVKDFYAREFGIVLSDYPRDDEWWTQEDNEDYYLQHFEKEGFFLVPDGKSNLKRGDVLLCRINNAYSINHAYIYMGADPSLISEAATPFIAQETVLHHGYGELSRRSVLGAARLGQCEFVARHKSMEI